MAARPSAPLTRAFFMEIVLPRRRAYVEVSRTLPRAAPSDGRSEPLRHAGNEPALLFFRGHTEALDLLGETHVGVEPRRVGVEVQECLRASIEGAALLLLQLDEPPQLGE